MTSDDADLVPVSGPWTRRLAASLAIPKRLELTDRGWVRLLRPDELMLVELRRLALRLERTAAYRERRARARALAAEPEPRDLRSVIREAVELTSGISQERLEEIWRRHLQRRRRR